MKNLADYFMKLLILSVLLFMAACNEVDAEKDARLKQEALTGFNGHWTTDYLEFDKDQCAFLFESSRNETEFVLSKFMLDCRKKGTSGIYATIHLKLAPVDSASPYDSIAKSAPQGALLMKTADGDSFSSGWVQPVTGDVYLNMSSSGIVAANSLSFRGNVRDGNLFLSNISMRTGYTVQTTVEMKTVTSSDVALSQRSPWSAAVLPFNARPSVSKSDRNYLYCVDSSGRTAPMISLVDFTSNRYPIYPDQHIGEIGSLAADGYTVYMARTEYGRAFMINGNMVYTLSLGLPGGRSTSMRIEFYDSQALMSSGGVVQFCQFIQNDVFAGKSGWNP